MLADRFAGATQTRYALEAEGERFLQQYDEKVAGGSAVSAADRTKEIEKDGYTLKITVTEPDASGSWDVTEWKVIKDWNADDPYQNIWQGN